MIAHKAHEWLFPLAFSNDDSIRYYAFLAIAALSANKELEAAVVKSGTLCLVEPFIRSHDPIKFGKSDYAHAHGQSKDWLSHLVPLLRSKREEALSLAAFHFAMEASILKEQGKLEVGSYVTVSVTNSTKVCNFPEPRWRYILMHFLVSGNELTVVPILNLF